MLSLIVNSYLLFWFQKKKPFRKTKEVSRTGISQSSKSLQGFFQDGKDIVMVERRPCLIKALVLHDMFCPLL